MTWRHYVVDALAYRLFFKAQFVGRNRTTLAPDIVAAILDETLPPAVILFELAVGTPLV